MWRAVHEALPSCINLAKRKLAVEPWCGKCWANETIAHVIMLKLCGRSPVYGIPSKQSFMKKLWILLVATFWRIQGHKKIIGFFDAELQTIRDGHQLAAN